VHKRGKLLDAPLKKLQGRETARTSAAGLHALRIACKKLRYSAEMFGSLYAAGKTRRYVASLSGLQDTLGVLNDFAVARRLLDGMENATRHQALDLVRGWIEHDHAEKMSELRRAWKRFSGQKRFWG